jgi:TPR repeat protein
MAEKRDCVNFQDEAYDEALYYKSIKDYSSMVCYYELSIKNTNNNKAMCDLGNYYFSIVNDQLLSMQYYDMASKYGNVEAMCNLALCYNENDDHINMKKYNMMAISHGSTDAMINMSIYYKKTKKYIFRFNIRSYY